MKRTTLLALTLAALPLSALALPSVGDVVGTDPASATAALAEKGCTAPEFEAEDGKIEAKCIDAATGRIAEIYLDPATGAVTQIKTEEE